jgi:hypothetical protein
MFIPAQFDGQRNQSKRNSAWCGVHDVEKYVVRFRMKIHITDGIAAPAAMICKSANYVAFYRATKVRPALELLKQRLVHSPNIEDGEPFKRLL